MRELNLAASFQPCECGRAMALWLRPSGAAAAAENSNKDSVCAMSSGLRGWVRGISDENLARLWLVQVVTAPMGAVRRRGLSASPRSHLVMVVVSGRKHRFGAGSIN